MRPSLALALSIAACLLVSDFRLDGLPFIPAAQFSDAAVSHYPAALIIFRDGVYTSWTELNMAGQPFTANPLNKTAYPPQILTQLIAPPLSLNLLLMLHIALAAAGMWGWARRLGLSQSAAGIASLAYALSPRLIGHIAAGHLDLVYAMAWFPILMIAVDALVHKPTVSGLIFMSLAEAMLILTDLRLSLFALPTAGIYAIALAAQKHQWRRLLLLTFGAALWATILTLSVTIPLLLWQPFLSRATLTSAEAGAFSLNPGALIGLLLAPPAVDVEMQTFVGIAVLFLAGVAIVGAPRKHLLWWGLLIFAALYALGSNGFVWSILVEVFPPLRWFRVPARAWFVVALIMPLLAGYGAQMLLEIHPPHLNRSGLPLTNALGGVAIIFGIFVWATTPQLAQSGLRLMLIGGGTAIVFGWALRRKRDRRFVQIAVFALILIDLGWNTRLWLEWRGRDDWMTPHVALAETLRADNADRIYSPAYSLPQQVAAEYELHLFGGVDPFQLRGIADAIESASGVGHHGYTVTQPPLVGGEGDDLSTVNQSAVPDTEMLAAWQVSHVVAPYPIEHLRLSLLAVSEDAYVYRNLDYRLTIPREQVPRWADADGLPDAETIERNNQLTGLLQGVTSLPQVLTALAMIYFYRRERLESP